MAISIVSSVQSMARKLSAAIHESPSSSSSDQVSSSVKKDLKSLKGTLRRIQAVLNDAEEREIRDASVKLWLKELRLVAYDAENVLGEYQYEVQRAEIITSAAAETSLKREKRQDHDKVYDFTSVLKQLLIPEKIRAIMERFAGISKALKDLKLRKEDGKRRRLMSYVPQPSSSLVDESGIFGREDDKEAVVQMLLSDKVISSKISVISIVGMGGLGKTTLAQYVYNDSRVCQYFDSKGWICVSDDFDVNRLTGEIIQSITKNSCTGLMTQLDALQSKLKEIVDGKKVLVVLDDVWNETPSFWESLKAPFLNATTVRVLVTTRNESVAKIMQTSGLNMYRLDCLPEGICWTLFRHYAFSGQNPEEHPRLVEIGRKIMQKCGGLPLAVKTLGSLLLHYGTDEESWKEVLESEIWELDGAKDDILPALKLSYYRMPTHLKPCFLLTSLYPKDFKFKKDKVIKMWMAQDYIPARGNKRLEDIGSEYFDELQRRSFFLYVNDLSEKYVLHDIVHDLARHISDNEHHSVVLESDGKISPPIAAEVRHLFVACQRGATLCQVPLEVTRDLRTLIVVHYSDHRPIIDDDQFEHSVHLRVLEVDCEGLPYSIVNLKRLCYLNWNLSNEYAFTHVDDDDDFLSLRISKSSCTFLSKLYNMQTLYLFCEDDFVRVLGTLRYLANLRHLHLESFIEYGSTCILPTMPDANFTQRGMICYSSTYFSKLVEISLSHSSGANWLSLLPFSRLPSLRRLRVKSMRKLERVGHENYCYCPLHLGVGGDDTGNSVITTNNVGFPCLEELIFEDMRKWEEWSGVMDGDFPCLCKLTLTRCRSLRQIPMLPSSLKTLHISECERLKSLPVNNEQVSFPCMKELVFNHMPELEELPGLKRGDFPCLRKLTIKDCNKLRGFPLLPSSVDKKYHWLLQVRFPYLEEIVIEDIPELQYEWFGLAGGGYFPCLRKLTISRCQKLLGVPTILLSSSLKLLSIKSCWSLTSLAGLQNHTSLESLELERCPNLHISPKKEGLPSRPQHVKIVDCPLLQEWCNMHQFNCIQEYYGLAELTIKNIQTIINDLGADNLTSLERLELKVEETHLPPDGWLPPMIQILKVCSCNRLLSLSLHHNLLLLTRLEIRSCRLLASFDGMHNLPNLEELSLENCPQLQLLTDNSLPSPLQSLSVIDCQKLRSLPLLHEKLSSLEKLQVSNCPEMTIVDGLHNLSSLKTLIIRQCPHLRLSSDEQLSSMPHFLSIEDCPDLEEWCQQQSIPYNQVTIGASAITDGLSVLPPPREVIEWDNLAAISHPPAATSETSGTSAPMEQLNQGLRELKLNSHNKCNEENRGQSNRTTSEEKQAQGGDGSQNLNFRDQWLSLKVSYSEIENATNGLCESSKIGKGGFGSVYKGKLRGTDVAIKILDSSSEQGAKEFFREIEVLSEMRHPNVVKLVGACFEIRALVYEYLPRGSLEDCLKENPNLLTWQMRTRIIYEVCLALIYLHSESVVHSDLKPANILLDANFKSKLSDFGLSRFLPKDMTSAVFLETNPKGTQGYIDPWFFETGVLTPGSDLYSFGVTILRLLTGLPVFGLVGFAKKACEDENLFRKMIDPDGSWPFEMAKELLNWSLRCCDTNENSRELLKNMSTKIENTWRRKI